MTASKANPALKYEPSIDEADFRPSTKGHKSGIVVKPKVKPRKPGKGKRSAEDMLASMDNDAAKAKYVLDRIAGLEEQIHGLLKLCEADVLAIVLKARKSLAKYAPEK